jgi:hypothetical protein
MAHSLDAGFGFETAELQTGGANLGQAAGQDDKYVFALIWNPRD